MSEVAIQKHRRFKATQKVIDRTSEIILELTSHTIVMISALFSMWLVHKVLEATFGKAPTFFGLVPIRWLIDAADMAIIGMFVLEFLKNFSGKGNKKR